MWRLCSSSPICSAWAISGLSGRPPRCADAALQRRAEHVAHPAQPGQHFGRERPVAQHLAHALVQRGIGEVAPVRVAHHVHRHGGRDQPRHRPDGAVVVAGLEAHPAAFGQLAGLGLVGCPAFEQDRADDRALHGAAHPLPLDRRPGVEQQPVVHLRPDLAGGAHVLPDRLGAPGCAARLLRWPRRCAPPGCPAPCRRQARPVAPQLRVALRGRLPLDVQVRRAHRPNVSAKLRTPTFSTGGLLVIRLPSGYRCRLAWHDY